MFICYTEELFTTRWHSLIIVHGWVFVELLPHESIYPSIRMFSTVQRTHPEAITFLASSTDSSLYSLPGVPHTHTHTHTHTHVTCSTLHRTGLCVSRGCAPIHEQWAGTIHSRIVPTILCAKWREGRCECCTPRTRCSVSRPLHRSTVHPTGHAQCLAGQEPSLAESERGAQRDHGGTEGHGDAFLHGAQGRGTRLCLLVEVGPHPHTTCMTFMSHTLTLAGTTSGWSACLETGWCYVRDTGGYILYQALWKQSKVVGS